MTTMFEEIQIEKVRANPANIREDLGDMERLAAEVKTVGIRSPLVVYPHPDIEGDFMIQEGHRRRQAALAAGLSELPCIIVEAPKRPAEDVEVMLSTGRNHKPLTRLEEARGFQTLLDLGLNESTIGKKFKQPKSEVVTKARITKADEKLRDAYGKGAIDLVAAKRLQDLEDAGRTGVYERVVDQVHTQATRGYATGNVERAIAEAELQEEIRTEKERLTALGGEEGAPDISYSGKYSPVHGLTDEEHVAAGHLWRVGHNYGSEEATTTWYAKNAKAKPEPTEQEKAEKQQLRALAGGLAISYRVRRQFVVEQILDPQGGVDQATDQRMLFELLVPGLLEMDDEVLVDLTGIARPEGAEQMYSPKRTEWVGKVRDRLSTFTWRQLARAYALRRYEESDRALRNPKSFERDYYWSDRRDWLNNVQQWFGYRLDQTEQDTLTFFRDKAGGDSGANPELDVEVLS